MRDLAPNRVAASAKDNPLRSRCRRSTRLIRPRVSAALTSNASYFPGWTWTEKPGRFAKLRELQISEVFPSSVIAYHAGHLDDATLKRFKDGMIGAGQRTGTKRVLMLWKMTGFEAIPEDYERTLIDIAKVYPP